MEEYTSKFVKENLKEVLDRGGEIPSQSINWETLDIYGMYLEDKWIPIDAGSYDDAFDIGIEIGIELQKLDYLLG